MTKQEEIREGIAARLEIAYNAGLSKRTCNTNEMASQAVAQLHSQGVVIKVEGELPEAPIPCPEPIPNDVYFYRGYERCKDDMAGYVAVASLVKREENV